MLREIFETTSSVLRLAHDVKASQDTIKEIQDQLHDLVMVVEHLRYETQRVAEREERERQMLMLKMENVLLRERQVVALPAANGAGEPDAHPPRVEDPPLRLQPEPARCSPSAPACGPA